MLTAEMSASLGAASLETRSILEERSWVPESLKQPEIPSITTKTTTNFSSGKGKISQKR